MGKRDLKTELAARTAAGTLVEGAGEARLRCLACAHRCVLQDGQRGVCKVRWAERGTLRVPRGYVGALQVDPVEKKPFFHVLPGSDAMSFGMLGCDYRCDYCQNWITSQALRDGASEAGGAAPRDLSAEDLVGLAVDRGAPILVSTYNEPLITSEWAAEVFDLARAKGLLTGYVSNGNATPEVLDFLVPRLDLYKVDLKAFKDSTYRRHFGGPLKPVLETLGGLKARGVWVEVVTLVVPGLNDSEDELKGIALFLASLSKDLPWHVTGFHPDYRMDDREATPSPTLRRAWEVGKAAGLRYVYTGNRPGEVGGTEDTECPGCGAVLVTRRGFQVSKDRLGPGGKCPACGWAVPGIWARREGPA
jgi:pyruvate formate lyase activating enzyme